MKGNEFVELYVKDGRILPNDVDVIEGDLDLDNNRIEKTENLPDVIKGDLYLDHNQIEKIKNLPDVIKGRLFLNHNPIYKEFERSNFDDEFKFCKWKLKQRNIEIWREINDKIRISKNNLKK